MFPVFLSTTDFLNVFLGIPYVGLIAHARSPWKDSVFIGFVSLRVDTCVRLPCTLQCCFFFLPSVFSCYLNYQKVLVRRPTDISPNFISSIAHQNRLPHDYASAFIERSGWMLMLGRRGCARAAQRVH